MAIHSSIPAWRIPSTEQPGGLRATGSHSWTRLSRQPEQRPPPTPLTSGAPAIFSCSVPFLSLSSLFEYWMVCTWLKSARCVGFGKKRQTLENRCQTLVHYPCNPCGPPPTLFCRDTSQTGCLGSLTAHFVQEEWAFLPLRSWRGLARASCSLHDRGVSALCAPGGRGVLYLQELDEGLPRPRSEDMQRRREGAPDLTLRVTRSQGAFCPASLREGPVPTPSTP